MGQSDTVVENPCSSRELRKGFYNDLSNPKFFRACYCQRDLANHSAETAVLSNNENIR